MASPSKPAQLPVWVRDGELISEELKAVVSSHAKNVSSTKTEQQREGADRLYELIKSVWGLDTHFARDAADLVCDDIRESGCLDTLLQLYTTAEKDLLFSVARLLEQIMVASNRTYIANHALFESVVRVACKHALKYCESGIGILENFFKVSTETCKKLIHLQALESILFACRSPDSSVLRHCAATMANCAMFGESEARASMVHKHADHWLFPLAFSEDKEVAYYALLTICFLASELKEQISSSGTLDLVLPFIESQYPEDFARSCPNHAHGRSPSWLQRLLPLLSCKSEEARSLASFHFAMEAAVKKRQHRLHEFTDIGATCTLQEAAKRGSRLTAKLCCQALVTCDVAPPPYQCWDVLRWSTKNVSAWVEDIGLQQLAPSFEEHLVTGNTLVDLTMDDLLELGFQSKLRCKWFLEEVKKLRCLADVSRLDKDQVCKWLTSISPGLAVYRVDFIRLGVTKSILPHLTDSELAEIGVTSKLNRRKILLALKRLPEYQSGEDTPDIGVTNFTSEMLLYSPTLTKKYDVFISYRRAGGSQLASLLKVHLQTRGISAFLDVYGLGGGNFDEALIMTISNASNMVLVLSSGALDRCKGDARIQDWLHREIVCALEHKVNVVPVTDPAFKWPKEDELPKDIHPLSKLNAVPWSHEFQDAAIQRVVDFLQLPVVRGRAGSSADVMRYYRRTSSTQFDH